MKLFAFFLPQFHEIPENDEWWGKGFTEWTNVRKAQPLFKGHVQPLHPLGGNYYDLLDIETVKWQTRLMQDYRVDGLIYYHYYFCGKKLLEKPAENLLAHPEIPQNFFFCWANHDWNRAWKGSREVLQKQTYGGPKEWEEHFRYLLPFFKDSRYEKKDGCPLLMVFDPGFPEKKELFSYFEKRCKEEGFGGLYLIETFSGAAYPDEFAEFAANAAAQTKALFLREPTVSRGIYWRTLKNLPLRVYCHFKAMADPANTPFHVLKGDDLIKQELAKEPFDGSVVHGVHFGFDNTSRHGKRGYVITPPSREMFEKLMDRLAGEEYVFLNAWNEWAESMTVEPTEEYGHSFLEWIRDWKEKTENA